MYLSNNVYIYMEYIWMDFNTHLVKITIFCILCFALPPVPIIAVLTIISSSSSSSSSSSFSSSSSSRFLPSPSSFLPCFDLFPSWSSSALSFLPSPSLFLPSFDLSTLNDFLYHFQFQNYQLIYHPFPTHWLCFGYY